MCFTQCACMLLKCLFVNLKNKNRDFVTYDVRVGHAPWFEGKGHARALTSSTAPASFWSVCVDSGFCIHTCGLSYVNLSLLGPVYKLILLCHNR